ncbi:MAG: TIGR03032 family protein, partial [Cyanobacteria bacterium J06632_22]
MPVIEDARRSVVPMESSTPNSLTISNSPDFVSWLAAQQVSLAFTTYQTNRLFLIGHTDEGTLAAHERLFDKPMGLFNRSLPGPNGPQSRLYMSTRYQLWQFENMLAAGENYGESDLLYVPRLAHTTGDLNVHDVVWSADDQLLFVNTDFSCLATLSETYSFVPVWQPSFISKLVAEDRCHLNGLAMVEGQPTYMTACSATDSPAGWRDHRRDGGVMLSIPDNEIIAKGLSMPHSPRWYRDRLWVLNAGTGEFGSVGLSTGKFEPMVFCPGFVRGLAFWRQFAIIGLSKLRARPFTGLALEERLQQNGQTAQCGLLVVDLDRGEVVHSLQMQGVVEELFDIVVLPGVRRPQTLGLQNDDIQRLVTFPGSGGICTTKPTARRAGIGAAPPVAGLPNPYANPSLKVKNTREATPKSVPSGPVKYQRVFHLTPKNCLDYDALTFPSLQARWQQQPVRGELFGLSASVQGKMVGFAIAECLPDHTTELISLFVDAAHRQQGIGTRLVDYLEQGLRQEGGRHISVTYEPTPLTQQGLEPLLRNVGWSAPRAAGHHQYAEKRLLPLDGAPAAPSTPALPKVSLVMTVYNAEAYLPEALDSLLAQTFPEWELILWDDGSTDGSVAIAQDYAQQDSRIRFHQGGHLGRGPALIKAHALTQGEYVGWLDADDRLAPTALAETVAVLDQQPDYGMVYTNHIDMDAAGQTQGLGYRCQLPYHPQRLLIDMLTFHLRLLRQSIFDALGGIRPEFAPAEDYDLSLRVSEVTSIYHLERPLYFYRHTPTGLSQQNHRVQQHCSEQAVNDALARRGLSQAYELFVNDETGRSRLQRRANIPLPAAAKAQFETGKRLVREGNLAAALESFNQATFLAPDYGAAYNQLGKVQQQLGQWDAAMATYQHLLSMVNPNLAEAHCNLGAIWQMQGKTDEALAAYRQAVDLKPELAAAHLNLAKLLVSLEQSPDAVEHYRAVIQVDPNPWESHYGLGQIALVQDNVEQAKQAFDQVLALRPSDGKILSSLGQFYESQGDFGQARRCYQDLVTDHPEYRTMAALQISHIRRHWCDWQDDEVRVPAVLKRIEAHVQQPTNSPLLPLSLSLLSAAPALHRAVNEHYAAHIEQRVATLKSGGAFEHPTGPVETLRIGYLSP